MKLQPEQDAFGWAIYDRLNGREAQEVIERDDGFIDVMDALNYTRPVKTWPGKRYARGRVVDVGCGAGRHALALQREGFEVLGIDISPMVIKAARQLGLRKTKVLSITEMNSRLGPFDTIQMLGNNFGLFGNRKRAQWLLRRFYRATGDGGRIIAQSNDVYQTCDPLHLAYHRWNRRRGRMAGQIRMRVRYRIYCTPWFDYLMVPQDEMKEILNGTGWQVRRFIETAGSSYVAIIEKQN